MPLKISISFFGNPSLMKIQLHNLDQASASKSWPNSALKTWPKFSFKIIDITSASELWPKFSFKIFDAFLSINISNIKKFWVSILKGQSHISQVFISVRTYQETSMFFRGRSVNTKLFLIRKLTIIIGKLTIITRQCLKSFTFLSPFPIIVLILLAFPTLRRLLIRSERRVPTQERRLTSWSLLLLPRFPGSSQVYINSFHS